MQTNFLDISYLNEGNTIQKRACKLLESYQIFSILSSYHPVLVGTIPIKIDVENSDLDIICDFEKEEEFKALLINKFSFYPSFQLTHRDNGIILCSFYLEEMMIEIYASSCLPTLSNGYRHMLIEDRILKLLGEEFRKKIISLKQEGIKTEPAFAKLLNLQGNPYQALLELETYTDEEIYKIYGLNNETPPKV